MGPPIDMKQKDVSHPFMTMILTSMNVVGCMLVGSDLYSHNMDIKELFAFAVGVGVPLSITNLQFLVENTIIWLIKTD